MSFLILALLAFAIPVAGQSGGAWPGVEDRGVVWTPPDELEDIRNDLRVMQSAGMNAARIPFSDNPSLYRDAAHAGIRLYVDLPVAWLPSEALADTLFMRSSC